MFFASALVAASGCVSGRDVGSAPTVATPAESRPRIQHVVSPGGIEAWLVEERFIPMLAIEIGFAGGASLDPDAGHAGRAQLLAGALEEGSGEYDAPAFRREADAVALRLHAGVGRDRFRIGARMLTRHRARSLELLRLYLAEPRFEAGGVGRTQARTVASLEQSLEQPDVVAGIEWGRLAYPEDPYGRPVAGTPESVAGLSVQDLRPAHAEQFDLGRLKVGVVGDISAAELGPVLDELFRGLPRHAYVPPAPVAAPVARGLAVIERDVPQSAVRFGHAGLRRDDADFIPAYVLNYILGGGGFDSRLNVAVRQERGLAYSAYSYLVPLVRAGLLLGGLNTSNETAREAVALVREEWRRLLEAGVDAEDLDRAKRYLTGSYPLNFDSNAKIAQWMMNTQFENLGIDYIDRRNALVEAVTLEELHRVAARLIDPDALLFVVVGRPTGMSTELN